MPTGAELQKAKSLLSRRIQQAKKSEGTDKAA
jgi:hypothetical protein